MDKRIRLILASSSPRRRQLLKKLGHPFRVIPSHVPEDSTEKNPAKLVQDLALRKAHEIGRRMKGQSAIVIGADTVVVLRHRIMGKPLDAVDASRMLGQLAGTTHQVYTGVALVDAASGKSIMSYARSDVRMKKVAVNDLARLSGRHLDKAGSYAIQEKKDPLARVIKGSYDNVVGLPVELVDKLLQRLLHSRPTKDLP
jgi:septum formation protein